MRFLRCLIVGVYFLCFFSVHLLFAENDSLLSLLPKKGDLQQNLSAEPLWQRKAAGLNELEIKNLSGDEQMLVVTTNHSVYISNDKGKHFEKVFRLLNTDQEINDVYISSFKRHIYLATDLGLFESKDLGDHWDKTFEVIDQKSGKCYAVSEMDSGIYLGTDKGLFTRYKGSSIWSPIYEELSGKTIFYLHGFDDQLLVGTGDELYFVDTRINEIRQIYKGQVAGTLNGERYIRSVTVGESRNMILLGTVGGFFVSFDYGNHWEKLEADSLSFYTHLNETVLFQNSCKELACLNFMIATDDGIYQYQNNNWLYVYSGLHSDQVNDLTIFNQMFWAATSSGLYALCPWNGHSNHVKAFNHEGNTDSYLGSEPGIKQVQEWAIQNSNTSNEKIEQWKKLSKRKAWLPQLSIGLDVDKNMTLSDKVWGTYSSGGQIYIGPDGKTFYDNLGWDVSLSWDFTDLIWSTDQTTIDTRSKSTVELREDILERVTRLYFERRRLRWEQIYSDYSKNEKVLKEMRIDELTALIDALTGGKFSYAITR